MQSPKGPRTFGAFSLEQGWQGRDSRAPVRLILIEMERFQVIKVDQYPTLVI